MSVTTKSMVLLAAMGLAACDSSNSNSPTPPAVSDPAPSEIAVATRAKAIENFTATDAGLAIRTGAVSDARTALEDIDAKGLSR
ncbi:hypothetical protein [Yoonia sp.]|uniref:hypothetical protein n=1 Tax=Yoonia sp. TaxID=2212373 RepID=UPI003A4D35ED